MPRYRLQKRIHSLLEYGVYGDGGLMRFTRYNISFSPWEPDVATAWQSRYWLAEYEKEAESFTEAWKAFDKSLTHVASRIAFVGQAYYMHAWQPFLALKKGSDMALFRHCKERSAVPLMFDQQELRSLDILLEHDEIPDAFFLYWHDAINTVGYSSKLVLMFGAIEILFQKASRSKVAFYADMERLFGPELKRELYGTSEDKGWSGVRQRLIHGDYLSEADTKRNYVREIHTHILRYFNESVLRTSPINEAVVGPQRHPYGNIGLWEGFTRLEAGAPLELKPVLAAFDADENNPEGYVIVPPDERPDSY